MNKLEDIRPKTNSNASINDKTGFYDALAGVKREETKEESKINIYRPSSQPEPLSSFDTLNLRKEREESSFSYREPSRIQNDEIEIKDKPESGARIWLLAGISIMGLAIAISFLFAKATVSIHPKVASVVLDNEKFTGNLGVPTAEIPFELMVISGDMLSDEDEEKDLNSQNTQAPENVRATGRVVIFNQTLKDVRLKEETRLETKDGKIYKTDIAVVVPAATKKGAEVVPGSIEVGAHADLYGPSYNIGLVDFVIFGFKGTAREKTVYARSKTPIEGGKGSGTPAPSVAPLSSSGIDSDAMYKKLYQKAVNETPEGFVFFDDGVFFDSGKIITSDSAEVSVSPKLSVFIFSKDRLAKAIARASLRDFDDGSVSIPDWNQIAMKIDNRENLDPVNTREISFTLSGQTRVIWAPDASIVRNVLVDTKKKDFNSKMEGISGIDMAELTLRPFWMRSLPEEEEDINVKIINP